MKAVVAALNQEKALVGAFSVIANSRMELFGALAETVDRAESWGHFLIPEQNVWTEMFRFESLVAS